MKLLSVVLPTTLIFFSACSSSPNTSNTSSTNTPPTVIEASKSVALMEYTTSVTNLLANVIDVDTEDSLRVVSVTKSDGGALPTGYSLSANELTIDASDIDVDDGVNLSYNLDVTVSDESNASVSYTLNTTIQDSVNDGILTVSDIVMADTTLVLGTDFNVSMSVSDTDGVDSLVYTILNDANSSIDSGSLSLVENDNYSIALSSSDYGVGSYTLEVNATGNIGGEIANSKVDKSLSFSIFTDAPTTIVKPSVDTKSDTTIVVTGSSFSDDDGVRNVTIGLYYDDALANLVTTSKDGNFTSLDEDTTYYAVIQGEAFNSESEEWEAKVSEVVSIATEITPDEATTITKATLDSKDETTIGTTVGDFDDADGVRNVTVALYNDSDLTDLNATNDDGNFSGLDDNVTYYIVTQGEALNGESDEWEAKKSEVLTVTTDLNDAPVWTADSYDTGLTIEDDNDDVKEIKNLADVSSDDEGDEITYSIVSIDVPSSNEQEIWDDSIYIENDILIVKNLMTNDPDGEGTVTVTVKAEATGGSNTTEISFEFNNVQ